MNNMPTPMWGVLVTPATGAVTLTKEYAQWLGSFLDESCTCGPHIDHADCIAEVEAFISFTKRLTGSEGS